ncbi:MAG: NADH-quinone oxidoreductase subunit NuoE [Dehalococcoidia bacterium]|nr:NADH-quinone oxidoreductase subunit NuoE [Dehalococcoidia bacterium]
MADASAIAGAIDSTRDGADGGKFLEKTERVLKRFGRKRENLVPILQHVQSRLGYIPREAMLRIADYLGLPATEIYGVVTFYNQFRLNPPGKHPVRVCLGTACHMKGGYIVLDAWKRRLGIKQGETTPDRNFDLDTVACVGCCSMAPVTVVDKRVQGNVSPTRVDGILLSYFLKKGRKRNRTR